MKPEEEIKILRRVLVIILFGLIIYFFLDTIPNSSEELYKTILKADADLLEISVDSQMAESYYAEAGYAYEDKDYNTVESNCRLAREYYFEESQGYKKVKAELKDKEIDDKLIVLYIENLELLSEISNNMFEACEHFEVAARYYDTYFNYNVPYDDTSYDMADKEINMMNEKISAHDNAVEKYNNKLSEFRFELEKRLED